MKISKLYVMLGMLIIFNTGFGSVFRTTVTPGRIFVSSDGGNESIEIENISDENVKYIKIYPSEFEIKPKSKRVVRLKVLPEFFLDEKTEKILYITEVSPLIIINKRKIMPRHGVTIKKNHF
ncbi:MAG: hypothetical protein RR476_08410 [Cetobacterium sp.]|uniref:hypothetical protein n=1 Tax=Cetobacterium sp. TaxID=2071632 RepID=UPI002FC6D4CA